MAMKKRFYTVDGQMVGYEEGGVRKDFLTDHLGSIIAIMDENEVRVFDTRYSAYGRNRWITGTGCGFGWVGSFGYRETGLFHMSHYVRARHYSYVTGSWSTVDPLWPRQPAFQYLGGRATRYKDPTGLCNPATACADYETGIIKDQGNGVDIGNGDLIRPGSDVTGFLLCCDGKFTRCSSKNNKKNPIAVRCTKEHEGVHEADVRPCPQCTGQPPTRPGFVPDEIASPSECRAHQAGLRCLKRECDKDKGVNKGTNECAELYPSMEYTKARCRAVKRRCAFAPNVPIEKEIIDICNAAGVPLP